METMGNFIFGKLYDAEEILILGLLIMPEEFTDTN